MTERMNRLLCFLIVGVILSGGCMPATVQTSSSADSPEPAPPTGPARSINMIRLQLVTIEVPTGIASGTEELWSYLDEEPVALQSTILGLNGFRVGIGRSDSWADIERVLKKMTGLEQKITNIQIFSGKPNPIVLKPNQPIQTIFTYFEDQSLSGADYPAGDNILAIACSVDQDNRDKILLTAVPQIRSIKTAAKLVTEHGQPKLIYQPALFVFKSLTFQLTIKSDDFLIIAPGIQARRPDSIAHHFLTRSRGGIEYETLLLLRPKVFQVKLSGGQ